MKEKLSVYVCIILKRLVTHISTVGFTKCHRPTVWGRFESHP